MPRFHNINRLTETSRLTYKISSQSPRVLMSDGLYRGLASEAHLVLVRVSENGKITEPNTEHSMRWVIDNKDATTFAS
jgi:hypothetical protein